MSNKEKYTLLTKEFVNIDEVMIITELSKNKSRQLLHEITKECDENILMPRFKIPKKKLIEKRNIDVDGIFKLAEKEQKLDLRS